MAIMSDNLPAVRAQTLPTDSHHQTHYDKELLKTIGALTAKVDSVITALGSAEAHRQRVEDKQDNALQRIAVLEAHMKHSEDTSDRLSREAHSNTIKQARESAAHTALEERGNVTRARLTVIIAGATLLASIAGQVLATIFGL